MDKQTVFTLARWFDVYQNEIGASDDEYKLIANLIRPHDAEAAEHFERMIKT
jgi:hypothetical protein